MSQHSKTGNNKSLGIGDVVFVQLHEISNKLHAVLEAFTVSWVTSTVSSWKININIIRGEGGAFRSCETYVTHIG